LRQVRAVLDQLALGRGPDDDGWGWLYSRLESAAPPSSRQRRFLCRYYLPWKLETAGDGRLYRLLGVGHFGRFIPTGGVAIRRLTGARMVPYTLSGTSLESARDFFYRACVFESLHLPFFIALLAITVDRAASGLWAYAVEDSVVNLVVNLYPMMHHRNTRRRIVRLLSRRASRIRQTTNSARRAS